MTILDNIWRKWATSESIIIAARRVRISKDGPNVNDMQQDKFEQAANLIAQESKPINYRRKHTIKDIYSFVHPNRKLPTTFKHITLNVKVGKTEKQLWFN